MKYILIKTDNSLILVSDEEIKEGEPFYDFQLNVVAWKTNTGITHLTDKKVLSQSPKLSKEVADEIGWIDVEEMANEKYKYCNKDNLDKITEDEIHNYKNGVKQGFQKAQELNQKKYSEEDLVKAMDKAREEIKNSVGNIHYSFDYNTIIQSLSQPQQYSVEAQEIDGVWTINKIIK
jgi:hypothetical protein